jgi:HlyD family secretion protein
MKKWIIIISVVIVLAIGAVLARGKLFGKAESNGPAEMQTATVRRGDITISVEATGTIEPLVIVEVRSKASGAITKLAVDEGDRLEMGNLIAEVEKKYVKADVDQAQADLKSAKARLIQAQENIKLQEKQSTVQIQQAKENVLDSQTRLEKLREEIELEKEANARQVKEAENDLAMTKLRLEQSKKSRPESVKRAEATVKQNEINLELAQEEYNRQKALYEKNFVSKSEVDSAKAKLESAQSQCDSSKLQLKMTSEPSSAEELKLAELSVTKSELSLEAAKHRVRQEKSREKELKLSESQLKDAKTSLELAEANKVQIDLKKRDLDAAQASVTRAEVSLQAAQDRLDDTVVTAPITGTILEKNIEEGQVITSSMSATASAGTLLVTMADLENVYVKTEVDESDIGKVQSGQTVIITVDAFPDEEFDGTVLKIAPQGRAIQNVTTFEVTTEISNPSRKLKPGMNASVEIMVADRRGVLVVDNEAIIDMRGRKMARVLLDGQPEERPRMLETGVRGWDTTEIVSGLEEGEVVMVMAPGQAGQGGMPEWMRDRMKNPMESFRRMQGGGPGGGRGPRGPR